MKNRLLFCVLAVMLVLPACDSVSQREPDSLVLYTTRQPFLLQGLIDAFTAEHGITVEVVYAKSGLLERLKIEGELTPADVVYMADYGELVLMAEAGLLKPVPEADSPWLASLPSRYRPDNMWFAVTKRVRAIFVHSKRTQGQNVAGYQDMTQPSLRGRVCMRSGLHPYNVGLLAAMTWHRGEAWTRTWLQAIKESLARRPQGNDRSQARAIYEGVCDVTIMNSYYLGKMLTSAEQDQRNWADALRMIIPEEDGGAYVSLSGTGMTRWTKKEEQARAFMAFLLSDEAQRWFMQTNIEYPIDATIELTGLLASWGRFAELPLDFVAVARLRPRMARLVDELRFDR
ncbi:MAG: extracellular solute-binding protein [Alphaproteobacteria bacterium GM202ARS2]|nr:extracellular solute-binding protein [Alphaproteobacteria bacterium GM202ARS2]